MHACTGTHLLDLAQLGYHSVGFEIVNIVREKAKSRNLMTEFPVINMRNYRLNRSFDAVLGLYECMRYDTFNRSTRGIP